VRPFDTLCRWGGEEFAVLLTEPVRLEDVKTISERLRAAVEKQAVRVEALDGRMVTLRVTASIGVAMYPQHGTTVHDLWRAANQALLKAKQPPKNQVVFYTPE
jgi:diguanylate cyclase (GGDEF)-like protein